MPSPTATHTPAPTPVRAVFGPRAGSLADDDGVAIFQSGVNIADFVVEVTFVGDLNGVWLPMRMDGTDRYQVVTLNEIAGSFLWDHGQRLAGSDTEWLRIDAAPNIRTGADARNHIRAAAYGGAGLLFINGAFMAELDFSGVTDAGDIHLIAFGARDEDASERDPVDMRFENFTIAPLDADAFAAMKPAGLPTPTPTAPRTSSTAFGPADGSLADADGAAFFAGGVSLTDFVAEATFVGDIRAVAMAARATVESEHSVFLWNLRGTPVWEHAIKLARAGSLETAQTAPSADIRTGADARNHVRAIAYGEVGLLFINGAFAAELDLSALTTPGDVILAAFGGSNPVSIRFEGFTVRPLEFAYGPQSGEIAYEDGFIGDFDSGISMSDGVIEAAFLNPHPTREGAWSAGFSLRDTGVDRFHAVLVRSNGKWSHFLRTGDADSEQELAEGYSERVSTGADGSNRLRVVAIGEDGWLFINGAFAAKLDLSGGADFGGVEAIANYFSDDGIPGRHTRFTDFTIRSAAR